MSAPADHGASAGLEKDVDVVIPCYDGERYLAETLESVLAQTYPHIRILVVDDGSTDGTRAIVERYAGRVDYVHQENRGQAAARNHGLRRTSGRYVCLLDADDLLLPDSIERLRDALEADEALDVSHGKTLAFRDGQRHRPVAESWRPHARGPDYLAPFSLICTVDICSALFRRSVFDRWGHFPEERSIQGCEDWYLWLRCVLGGARLGAIDRVTLLYRQHPAASSMGKPAIAARETELMRRAVELFREHDVTEEARWRVLQVGIAAVALRWLWLGDRGRFRELAERARGASRAGAMDPALRAVLERGEELGWQLAYLHLARALLDLGHPDLAEVMFLKTRDIRSLRRRAARAGTTPLLEGVVQALRAHATARLPAPLPRWSDHGPSELPHHASLDGALWHELGLLALHEGALDRAEEAFERASATNPSFALSYVGLARCELRRGRVTEAGRSLMRAVSLDPERVAEHLTRIQPEVPLVGPILRSLYSYGPFRRGLAAALGPVTRMARRAAET